MPNKMDMPMFLLRRFFDGSVLAARERAVLQVTFPWALLNQADKGTFFNHELLVMVLWGCFSILLSEPHVALITKRSQAKLDELF